MINKHLYNSLLFIGLISVLVLFNSCSTKKNTFTRRTYHNLTSHYNGYFNGKEALKDAQAELSRIALDNYSKILPVVNYGAKENISSITPNLDRAIAKASLVISRHSIYIKNVEYVNWIDDAYLLMGKANFYKQDYKSAITTFDFIGKKYKNSDIKFDAQLWTAKCNIQTREYDAALSLLDDLQNKIDKNKAPGKLKRDLALAYAELYQGQMNLGPTEEFIIKTLKYPHPKYQKARLRFVLAQIQQRKGDYNNATRNFHKVISLNPGYELAFNARINMAKCYDASAGNSKEIVKTLRKMLKDEKNKDYLDQIYSALADIAEKDGDSAGVITNLKESVKYSSKNKYQKGVASLKLANIYYRQPEYPGAQAYYDTAIISLPADYPDLQSVKRRASTLNDLVKYLNIVSREDSLQRIAKMPEKERNRFIEQLIAKIQEEEQKKQKEEAERAQGMAMMYRNRMNNPNAMGNDIGSGAGWYFYNPSAISFGFTEFEKKWGKRKLEDNWRLSDKEMVAEFGPDGQIAEADSTEADSLSKLSKDPKDKKTYEQHLPLTESLMRISNDKIMDALYNLGMIYYDGLSDYPKSVSSYESLIERYPDDTSHYQKSCYNLYEMCRAQGDNSKADIYKNLLFSKFPESDYAKVIKDPEYKKELIARRNKASTFYRNAYEAFQNQEYSKVMNYCAQGKTSTKDKNIITKFDFLETVSIGKIQGKDTLAVKLKKFISRYPKSDLIPRAQQLLDQLGLKDTLALAGTATGGVKPKGTARTFMPDTAAIHLFIVVADMKKVNVSALKIKVSDHNMKFNSLDKLSTSSLYLDDTHQLISVSNFEDKDKAMTYYTGIMNSTYVFSSLNKADYEAFIISVDNYPILYKNKDVEKYLEFFKENYHTK
ncbi:MAG: tetratricopeptide repeat protein [Bacteroidales bacterium]